jgi:5-carboxymethyl-2-hydroxymuconate isomerase
MPHVVLEYSDNVLEQVEFNDFFKKLHSLIIENGPFELKDIKSRAVRRENFYVADGNESNGFIHLTLSILTGRELNLKQALGERILSFLKQEFARSYEGMSCSISVEIRELDRDTYSKATSGNL